MNTVETQRSASMLSVWRASIHHDDCDPNAEFDPSTIVDTKLFLSHNDACNWAKDQLILCAEHHTIDHFYDIAEEFVY